MKKIFTSFFFFAGVLQVFAQRDVVRPSYSTGSSNVGTINSGSQSSSNSSSSYSTGSSNTTRYESQSNSNYENPARSDYRNSSDNNSRNNNNSYSRYYHSRSVPQTVYIKSAFYVRVGLGIATPMAGQTLNENADPYSCTMNFDAGQQISSYTALKKISFSAGLQAVMAFGWMANKNIGIEVDGYIGIAPKKYTAHFKNIIVDGAYPADITVTNKAVLPIFIAPCLLLKTSGKKVEVYGRSGPVISANGKVQREETYDFYSPGYHAAINQIVIKTKITSSVNVGFTAATGVNYKLKNNISLWGEVSLLSMSLFIKQEINTENSADGQSASLFPTVDYGYSGSNVNRYTQTGVQPTYAQPFSHLALNFGVAYGF